MERQMLSSLLTDTKNPGQATGRRKLMPGFPDLVFCCLHITPTHRLHNEVVELDDELKITNTANQLSTMLLCLDQAMESWSCGGMGW